MRAGSSTLIFTAAVAAVCAVAAIGIVGHRRAVAQDARIDALVAELAEVSRETRDAVGTAGRAPGEMAPETRAALFDDLKRTLTHEMGLMPISLLRERGGSFVELYATDSLGHDNYGTAGYLGGGYFITVKHAVIALGSDPSRPRTIEQVRLRIHGRDVPARIIDAGDAAREVDPGDWAILRVRENPELPALALDLRFLFQFATPIVRLGNDYSKGIVLASGYVGQRLPNDLVTCLTDGHPGVSGGGVLNQNGELVGIPIGRMQGDYRFSFILPIRAEMFRKVPALAKAFAEETHQPIGALDPAQ